MTSLSAEHSSIFISKLLDHGYDLRYDNVTHRLWILEDTETVGYIRLPIQLSYPFSDEDDITYVIIMIQSSHAAVGIFDNGELIDHKVFSSYMVRQKQGKSQVKHLKTKGKSKAGSRVRLAGTVQFFEDINEKLGEIFDYYEVDRIAFSCAKILIPYFYGSKVAPPFRKDDDRLLSIGKDLPSARLEVLMETHDFLTKGQIIIQTQKEKHIDRITQLSN